LALGVSSGREAPSSSISMPRPEKGLVLRERRRPGGRDTQSVGDPLRHLDALSDDTPSRASFRPFPPSNFLLGGQAMRLPVINGHADPRPPGYRRWRGSKSSYTFHSIRILTFPTPSTLFPQWLCEESSDAFGAISFTSWRLRFSVDFQPASQFVS